MILVYLNSRKMELTQQLEQQDRLCLNLQNQLNTAKNDLMGMMGGLQEIDAAIKKAQEEDRGDGQ